MRYFIALIVITIIGVTSTSFFNGMQEIHKMPMPQGAAAPATAGQSIQLSHNGHFYEDTIQISIWTSNPDSSIYYTLDGSRPSVTSNRYSKPIKIKGDSVMNTRVLRVIAVSGNKKSEEIAHTYFVGKDVRNRFSTLVVSLSTDPENLYDHETGIFVEGKLREEYILANPDKRIFHYHPANYNLRGRLYERPVNVEMFEQDGTRVIGQKAGMRTHGGWARSLEQKSIRLIARNEYEAGRGKFDYDFFADDRRFDVYGSYIRGYDSLVLRNTSNYEGTPMLNNQVASRLARDAGFHETSFFRSAAVFLNGRYYGFAFLEQLINEQSLQECYNAPEPAFDIAGVGETRLDEGTPEVLADLEALNTFAYKDLTDDRLYRELSKLIDIDNFLHYYALELYLGNSDWPHNNLKRWRYSGDVTAPNLHPYLDGRWRYILFDLDRTFGFMPDKQPTIERLLGDSIKNSPMLIALLKRPDVAQRFLAILSELANGPMAPVHIEKVLCSIYDQSWREVFIAQKAGKFSSSLVKDDNMMMFARSRWKELLPQIKNVLGITDTFELTVKGISTRVYPLGSTVSITPRLLRNEVFDGWLVNGILNNREQLDITGSDVRDGQVIVEQLSHVELPALQLTEVSEERNCVTLRNNTNKIIRTKGLYLTDDASDLRRWEFTPMRIMPGETVLIVGKRISKNTVLFTPQLNFNIQKQEIIILSDALGQVLDYKIVEP